jgi:Arc/MetJ-type ribon-helix-helix transcriptional regulator
MHRYIVDFVEHRTDPALSSRSDVIRDAIELWIWCSSRVDEDTITEKSKKAALAYEAEQTLIAFQASERTIQGLEALIEIGPSMYPKAKELIEQYIEIEEHPILLQKFKKLLSMMEE